MVYVASRKAAAMLGLHPQTLRRYANEGKIPHYRNSAGQRLYDVDAYLRGASRANIVCYCRVSSAQQRGDLGRQVAQMRELYPDAEIVTDVAGGLNWQRKGLLSILERLHRGDKLDVVVAHRDRLARFGFELIEWLVVQNGGAVLVLNQSDASPESELTEDLLAILHTFSCRMHGLRRYRTVQSRRIRVYPNANSRRFMIATWLDASRWTYNLTVEVLQSGIPAVWRHIAGMVMAELKVLKPEWESVPYQVKRTAVRDACRAMSNVKTFNRQLAADRARGERPDEDFAQLRFRSRKNPRQSCYVPDDAVTEHGVYHTILGPLRMAETIPAEHTRMPIGAGTRPVLAHRTAPGAMRH